MSISKLRNDLSSLVSQIARTKQPIIILKESVPIAVIQPYVQIDDNEAHLKELLVMNTDWFDEKDYKQMRKDVEKQVKRLHNE